MASYSHLINHIEQVSFQYLLKAYMHIDRSLLVFRPGPIFNAYGPISLHMYLSIIWTHLSRHMYQEGLLTHRYLYKDLHLLRPMDPTLSYGIHIAIQ